MFDTLNSTLQEYITPEVVNYFVLTFSLVCLGYLIACVIIRISILEKFSPDEYTQATAALCLILSIFLSERANYEFDIFVEGVKCLILCAMLLWTWMVQIKGPHHNQENCRDLLGKLVVVTGGNSGK